LHQNEEEQLMKEMMKLGIKNDGSKYQIARTTERTRVSLDESLRDKAINQKMERCAYIEARIIKPSVGSLRNYKKQIR